jgi:uncharacterized protein (TIGR00730 family)
MKKIAVFCGSSSGKKDVYKDAARNLADVFIKNNISLVYGGANRGLMGILANRMLEQKGQVMGIMPGFLIDKEVAHHGITELIRVETMHERKALIQQKSDGFIAMPGGFGTIEEIFEMITWGQLLIHKKPCAFLNINAYFSFVGSFLEKAVSEGFLKKEYKEMILIEDDPDTLVKEILNYRHPVIDKL